MKNVARRHATKPDPVGGQIYFATPTAQPRIEFLGMKCGVRADRCGCLPEMAMDAARWNESFAYDEAAPKRSHAVTTL